METRSTLPNHPVPDVVPGARSGVLRVDGLVERAIELSQESVGLLRRTALDEPFTCEEGWSVPGLRWRGIRLLDVLALARPLPAARFVRVCAGTYILPLAVADAESALLCDELSGEPLHVEHGAPWRLVVPGGKCFSSVKWVDRLELVSALGDGTAEAIARGRLSAR
jgi:DMSO/TMAO reductase YedYZ molybdopterin-dependent catalytic subunit